MSFINTRFVEDYWHLVDRVPAKEDIAVIHNASQFVAMVGKTQLPERKDDSHTNFEWIETKDALAGHWIHGEKTFRAALNVTTLDLMFLDYDEEDIRNISVIGKTKQELIAWTKSELLRRGAPNAEGFHMKLHYDIPDHPVNHGATYEVTDMDSVYAFCLLYSDTNLVLSNLVGNTVNAEPVRRWPHHFDIGTLITIARDMEGKASKTIGVGFAPPDDNIEEPYFYLNYWPAADLPVTELPYLLGNGEWTESFPGAILKTSEIIKYSSVDDQVGLLAGFLNSGIRNLLQLLNVKYIQTAV